jgi:osmotically inducible protein OsmC
MDPLYTAHATASGGRDGRATARSGSPDLSLKPPAELGGPSDQPDATNPEELFALGYGACFLSALQFSAGAKKLRTSKFTIDSAVSLGRDDSGFGIAVELHGTLPDVDRETAAELMHTAHQECPYSRATRGNIEVKLFVGDEEI